MALLPSRNSTAAQSPTASLVELKKGNKEQREAFIWDQSKAVYAIALLGTGDSDIAGELTIKAFKNAFSALKQINPKQMKMEIWEWLSQFIVDACAEYHEQYSSPPPNTPPSDPAADGSAQMDWETTVILGKQRVKRCISALPEEQQKVFVLRHQLQLNCEQIGAVINLPTDVVQSSLFRARVQVVKCLGRG